MPGPLSGILVVALEQAVAAPLCTCRLADAGARVIKIERAAGDFARDYDSVVLGQSAYFVWLNRGKESIVLDLKDVADGALLLRILQDADVFVQNLSPGAAERAGFGSAQLRSQFPRLVTCDISGYGESGPLSDRKAYDLLIQCETGLASLTGSPQEAGRVGVSVADICCGMNAHAAILQALFERQTTGYGAAIAVSLFDGLAEWMTVPLLHHDYGGSSPRRMGINHPSIAPYGAYTTSDGLQLVFAVQNEREWSAFCALVLKTPELATDPRFSSNSLRCENRTALDAGIEQSLAKLNRDEFAQLLRYAHIGFGLINSVGDLSVHAHLRRMEVLTPAGLVSLPAPPAVTMAKSLAVQATPSIGEHSAALRKEFRKSVLKPTPP